MHTMVLVDDKDEVRGRVSARISGDTGFPVVGTAGNGHDARLQSVGRLICVDQLTTTTRRHPVLTESDAERLRHAVYYDEARAVSLVLKEIWSAIDAQAEGPADYRLFMLGVANVLIQYGSTVGADTATVNADEVIGTILRMKSIDEFTGWVERFVVTLHEFGRRNRMDNAERTLTEAIRYIEDHYGDTDLTMRSVAGANGISVSYLGQLFKKYRDTTFVKFLTARRIKRAKEELSLSGNRIVEVAETCGYRDVYYFSHCFRKHVGVPPKRYREEHTWRP